VKCNVCEREFANSEDLKAHMERDHTLEDRGDEELEKPDMMQQEEEQAAEGPPIVPGKNN
jgi:C2H2 type zinc finger protein